MSVVVPVDQRRESMDFHIKKQGTEVTFHAGYLNRAARRRRAKMLKKRHK